MKNKNIKFSTKAIHIGSIPDPTTGAVITPIYATSTYIQESPGVHKGLDYGRSHNPTRFALEDCIASLENGARGFAFSSGLAGISAILDTLPAGSHILAGDDLYGGTYRLFERVKKISANLEITYIPLKDISEIAKYKKENTKLLWIETPTNPLLKIVDLELFAKEAKKHNLISVVDNTFASPFIQRPLDFGFDIVVHSSTKYINGHSDVIGGLVVTKENNQLAEKIGFVQNAVGSVPSPFDCFLVHRGVKTLAVRMKQHCQSALEIAKLLEEHPKIEKVLYPGLQSHPQYEIAKNQMDYFGGMITIFLKSDIEGVKKFLSSLKVFTLAESLGGVESLIEHPAIMTHASIPKEVREANGISDGLVRISVGIEDLEDLKQDLISGLEII